MKYVIWVFIMQGNQCVHERWYSEEEQRSAFNKAREIMQKNADKFESKPLMVEKNISGRWYAICNGRRSNWRTLYIEIYEMGKGEDL